ncbi:ATP-binding sensor histidine kinase [Nostoc sp. CMAA1605]|uniref:ATP-binding sensor histidine kinase n=1 Tax=Nostoc sp. CMAA1605 TaxID=2055159 RepID=UPI001F22828D|nr:AAA family ATPase [Nostoc sp. CMAA1605]
MTIFGNTKPGSHQDFMNMFNIPGYHISEQIYNGSKTLVYRGERTTDLLPVAIKLLKNPYPTFSELVQFRNQYTIAKNLCSPLIVDNYSLEPYQNSYALVMEDFGGISLKEYFKSVGKLDVKSLQEFLEIAIALCDALNILYQNHIIHKDIKPSNILINPVTKQVKLIDFSIASLLPRETQTLVNPNVLEGTLAYISPEQTGRMNRCVDYRTDFYSLGVTFYELLTGNLPFTANDPIELVHCHIAKTPPDFKHLENIPSVLSDIVMKLMAKNAEERYQSTTGLKFDLENCLNQLSTTGRIESFAIAQRDIGDRFLISDKLYGRETEVATILEAFDRVSLGATEMMLVAGFSGIGKTAVVNEVHKPIVRQRGYFIRGKFDQFQRNIPLSAFVQSFRDLMGQLLTESDSQIQAWQSKILAALGENSQVIIEVIPELEKIIGQQPQVPQLSGNAAQNRFNLLFQKFTQVFTSVNHPLVIFLDDLQWADSASLKLMQLLMADTGHLFIIGAYRDHEVNPAHPLMLTVNEIAQTAATINRINLAPLNSDQINDLVADTLKCEKNLASHLSALVFRKTQGNPFFTSQFLQALHQDGLIYFNYQSGCWECDITQVTQQSITDDIVDFMALQLKKLPTSTQNILRLAACIGNQFDLATLAIVAEKAELKTSHDLWPALQAGLILPQSDVYKFAIGDHHLSLNNKDYTIFTYKFLHDRVQQAAYSLIPPEQRETTHLLIGRLLLHNTPNIAIEDKIFAIVNQLNIGKNLITNPEEIHQLIELNFQAGIKAKTATAYITAVDYLTIGLQLLRAGSWRNQYDLTLELYEAITEACYLSGNFQNMEIYADIVIQNATNFLEQIPVYNTKIQACMAQSRHLEALKLALMVLRSLGIELPEQPEQKDITQAIAQANSLLQQQPIANLLQLPTMQDAKMLAAMQILSNIISAAYQAAPSFFKLIVIKQVELSILYGNAPESTYAYATYGLLTCTVLGDINLGYALGKVALELTDKLNAKKLKAKTLLAFNCFVRHWKEHLRTTLTPLIEAYTCGLENGDIEYAAMSAYVFGRYAYLSGQELDKLEKTISNYGQVISQLKQTTYANFNNVYHQSVLNLLGDNDDPCCLTGAKYDETKMLPLHYAANQVSIICQVHFCKLLLCNLFANYQQALENAAIVEKYLASINGLILIPNFYFYDSLTRLALYPHVSSSEQQDFITKVTENQVKLQSWAEFAPANHEHKFTLVAAQYHKILGHKSEAMEMYDRAISLAKEHGYLQEEALANELAAKFYLDWGKQRVAEEYMTEAYYSYARWGAKAKVVDLEQHYPQLLTKILQQTTTKLSSSETVRAKENFLTQKTFSSGNSSTISVTLDLNAVLKASHNLSSEIQLDKLLITLVEIVTTTAGADKCVLMLLDEDQLKIEAVSNVTQYSIVLQSQPLSESEEVPISLINVVKRTLQPSVVIDASSHPSFLADPYVLKHQPKSLLCVPILHQGKLLGVLYLENNLATGAFTSDRVELLNLLCTQAAISLQNARLYQNYQNYAQQLSNSLAQLQANETRFQNLANNIPGMVYQFRLGADGSVSTPYVSSGCLDLYGVEPELVMTGKFSIYALHHPDDHPAIEQAVLHSAQTLTPFEQEWRIVLPSGTVKWIQSAARPEKQPDGAILWDGVVIDISDRKQVEASLAKEREFLNAIIDNITDGIVVCDASGKLILFNKATREFHGLPVEAITPEQWAQHFDLYQADGKTKLSTTEIPLFRAFQGEIVENAEMVIAPKHGLQRILLASGQAIIDAAGNKIGAVAVMRDISDRKQAELALQQKSQDLEQALANLQNAQLQMIQSEKMSALGNLVAGVAHEMNNPLGFIAATLKQAKPTITDMIEHLRLYQENLTEENAEILDHAEEIDLEYSLEDLPKMIDSMTMACDRLKNISTSLRTFSRADRDYKVPFDIHQGIDSTVLILKHRLKANEQRPAIEVMTEYGELPRIECFPGQLNQVFMNILANAIDALEESNHQRTQEEIKANPNRISIKTAVENEFVKIAISDNGIGMSESVKQKIFDHLFTTKSVGKGTGLGLAIARQIIVEKHNGKLSVDSTLGQGTEFIITLPLT